MQRGAVDLATEMSLPVGEQNDGPGAGSLDRAAAILRALANGDRMGSRLSDLAAITGLGKATTHRVLGSLVQVGFVDQDPATRRYRLGFELYRLGQAAGDRFDLIGLARPMLDALAEETEDTVFLSIRDGLEAVCIDRRIGGFPVKTLTLEIGDRRPLGVGAGSLALLSALPDREVDGILERSERRLAKIPGFTVPEMRQLITRTRADGHSFNEGRIIPEMAAIGVSVQGPGRTVVASLSIAAISSRVGLERRAEIVTALLREATRLEKALNPVRQ